MGANNVSVVWSTSTGVVQLVSFPPIRCVHRISNLVQLVDSLRFNACTFPMKAGKSQMPVLVSDQAPRRIRSRFTKPFLHKRVCLIISCRAYSFLAQTRMPGRFTKHLRV
jgi:hypothetical protein